MTVSCLSVILYAPLALQMGVYHSMCVCVCVCVCVLVYIVPFAR